MDVREGDRKGETVVGAKSEDKEGSGKKESWVAQGEWKGMKLEYFVAGLLGVHGRALALATARKSA